MRNAQEVIAAIHGARYIGHKVGLQNTRALLDALGLNCRVPAIHVAGTNGKGSVCAMVERVLRQAIRCCEEQMTFDLSNQIG